MAKNVRAGDVLVATNFSRTLIIALPSVLESQKYCFLGLPWWSSDYEFACQHRVHGFNPWSGRPHMPCSN